MRTERGTKIEHHTKDHSPQTRTRASDFGSRSGSISVKQSPQQCSQHHRASYVGPQIQPLTIDIGHPPTQALSNTGPWSDPARTSGSGWPDPISSGQGMENPIHRPPKRTGRRKLLLKKRSSSSADVNDNLLSFTDVTP